MQHRSSAVHRLPVGQEPHPRVASAPTPWPCISRPPRCAGLAELFGGETGDEVDKFSRCGWHPGPLGLPIIDACGRWFVGGILERQTLGDHVAFVLDPVAAGDDEGGEHLTFSDVKHLEPGHDA